MGASYSCDKCGRNTSESSYYKCSSSSCGWVSCGACADEAGYKTVHVDKEDGGWTIAGKFFLAVVSKACPRCLSGVYQIHYP